ncbi:hypothetical protein L9F63_025813, partial [Diploptera punctata]
MYSRRLSRPELRLSDAVSGETSGNYKPHDHGLQPENLLQDHHRLVNVWSDEPNLQFKNICAAEVIKTLTKVHASRNKNRNSSLKHSSRTNCCYQNIP